VSDIESLLAQNPEHGFLVHLNDVYGDHGIVGMVLIRKLNEDIYFLDTFLMSCRVLGRHLDAWMLSKAFEVVKASGGRYLMAEFIDTARNKIAKPFLSEHGFEKYRSDLINGPISIGSADGELFIIQLSNLRIPFMEIYI
jgi:FkbH-like protein